MRSLFARALLDTKTDAALFVGREYELRRMLDGVTRGFNTLVLGERGSGKSSLLHYFGRLLREHGRSPVYVQGSLAQDERGVLELLHRNLFDAASGQAKDHGPLTTGNHHSTAIIDMVDRLQHGLYGSPFQYVVLLDDLPNPSATRQLFGRYRDLLWELPLQWVTTGDVKHKATYLTEPADVFFEQVLTLPPLVPQQAFRLLRLRTSEEEASDERLREVVAAAGGQPRRLLELAREALLSGHDPARQQEHRSNLAQRAATLGDAARRLFDELEACGPASASDTELLRRMNWSRGRAVQVFNKLEAAGVIRSHRQQVEGGGVRKVYELAEDTGA